LSNYANKFAGIVTRTQISDMTSGFRIYSRHSLEELGYSNTKNNGYAFQIEMTVCATKNKIEVTEVPITFIERELGKSKMNFGIIIEALMYLLKYRLKN
jgi:dolichol-phosphate mannosyltransferase